MKVARRDAVLYERSSWPEHGPEEEGLEMGEVLLVGRSLLE
jgi:hypothetical protein